MDEIAKTEARNYVSMAGFILLGLFSLVAILAPSGDFLPGNKLMYAVFGVLLLILSILLAVLGKRGLTTIFFFTEGMLILLGYLATKSEMIAPVIVGANAVLAILVLFSGDGKKFIFFLLALLEALFPLSAMLAWPAVITLVLLILTCVICAWFALCCAAERVRFPGRELVWEDEAIDFKTSGSAVGYLLFAMVCAVWTLYYFLSENFLPLAAVEATKQVVGILLIVLAILLFAIAKMRFTPMVFLVVGSIFIISTIAGGAAMFAYGAVFIILGLCAIFRSESRVLLALFLLLYGLTCFISVLITGNYSLGIFHAIINLIPGLVALYLGFAVFAQKKKLLA